MTVVSPALSFFLIALAFNAQSEATCPNSDQEFFNWSTSDTHGANFCSSGGEGVFSQAERLQCRRGTQLIIADPNNAESGAQMLKDFVQQATKIKTFLSAQPGPCYATVWLGHNDVCAGTLEKTRSSCSQGSDQDPINYCRTTPVAFERELRKGLDILITVPDLKIGVASLVRVSQLCNHGEKSACVTPSGFPECQDVWRATANFGSLIGFDHGICGSLISDCSDQRIIDAYETAKAYHDILAAVTAEYAALPAGAASRQISLSGQTVGGASKADGVSPAFSDAPWVYKFTTNQISCCDCFHPSFGGQDTAARILFDGMTCSSTDACCADNGDSLAQGLCTAEDTSGRFVSGLF